MLKAMRTNCIVILLTLFGCTVIEAAPVTYVIVTSEAQTIAQKPTHVATPSMPIAESLSLAKQHTINGYFEEAIEIYRELLELETNFITPEQRGNAAFALGQVSNQADEYVLARAALSIFIDEFPNDDRFPQAHYLRGVASEELQLWKLAISDYESYIASGSSLLASYVWERIADALLELSERETALEMYNLALQHPRSLIPKLILHEKLARIHWQAGEYSLAVVQYDEILSVARNAPYRAEMEYNAALALLDDGQIAAGLERLRNITLEYPETAHAYLALQALDQRGIAITDEEVAQISYQTGDYAAALAALKKIITGATISAEQYMMIGRSQRALGSYDDAQLTFQILTAVHPNSPLLGDALLEQGRTYFLSGNIEAAISQYSSIADDYPHLEAAAAEALWRIGYLYGTRGEPEKSLNFFMRLYESFPNSEQAESGLALAATAAVRTQDDATAAEIYTLLTEYASSPELRAEAWLWLGAHPELSEVGQDLALSQVAAHSPDGYFAARAADLLLEREPLSPPSQYRFTFDDASQRKEAENWLRQRWDIPQLGELWPLPDTLLNDVRLLRGQEMWILGEFDAAQDEFLALVNANGGDPLASYQLAIYLRDLSVYYPSLVAAANVIRLSGLPTLEVPSYIARLRYPIYFLQPLLESTQTRDLDPLMLFALIRQESLFNAHATAAAGEKGLTQVIPSTGDYIASRLAWPNYEHADLFRPYASIEFGSYYLAEQLARFDQNPLAALAGYNAGPGRAADWLALAGGDTELFISTITIDSTRMYVQRIYAQHAIYRELYGEESGAE